MSDPRSPRTRAQEEAAEWLARLGSQPISTKTVREFRDWRDDPANDAAYEEAEAFWDASGAQAADPEIMRMTQAALDRGARRAGWLAWLKGPRLAGMAALASLVVAGSGVLVANQLYPIYATQDVEQKVVRLEDGSRVHLNVDSQVRVDFRGDERRIRLTRGEAFFDVAHDTARPFVVEAVGAQVRALGTKFDVRRQDAELKVTLLQGAVQVTPNPGAKPVVLAPNEQVLVRRGGKLRKITDDAARTTSWTTGRLVFRNTPLAAAVAEVNRYSDQKVEIRGADLGSRPVSGFFDVGDSESFARGVADLFDLSLTRRPEGAWQLAPASAPAA